MKYVETQPKKLTGSRFLATLSLVQLLTGCGARSADAPSADRPNIVILVSDDQDYEHFGFAGHPLAHTPIIDRLAREGFTFNHAFVPMSRCRPAQAALLGGEWPHQSNVYYNVGADHIDPQTSIANLLSDAGYETIGEGKFWEYDPRLMGFSNYTIRNYETFGREGQEHLFRWLDDNHGERPFFLWWAPELPHVPHNPPERLLALFDPDAIEVPPWIEGDPEIYREDEHKSLAMEGLARRVRRTAGGQAGRARRAREHALPLPDRQRLCQRLAFEGNRLRQGLADAGDFHLARWHRSFRRRSRERRTRGCR